MKVEEISSEKELDRSAGQMAKSEFPNENTEFDDSSNLPNPLQVDKKTLFRD